MKILISSRYKNQPRWSAVKDILLNNGHEVITPLDIDMELHGKNDCEMSGAEYLKSVERFHSLINEVDLLYVLNYDGEFGNSMMLEIGYASALGKNIIALEPLTKEPSLKLFIKEILKPEEIGL